MSSRLFKLWIFLNLLAKVENMKYFKYQVANISVYEKLNFREVLSFFVKKILEGTGKEKLKG